MATPNVAFRVHSVGGTGVPVVQPLAYTGSPAIVIGSVCIWNAGYVDIAGANPTEVVGVALQAVDTNPGFSAANSPATITGRNSTVSVVRPNNQTVFCGQATNNSSTIVVGARANVGAQYGLTAYSGIWTVDFNKSASNLLVEVVGFDTTLYSSVGVVFFKFLPSVLSDN